MPRFAFRTPMEEPAEESRSAAPAAAGLGPPRLVWRTVWALAGAAAGLWAIRALWSVILLLIASVFFAYLLDPLVALAQRRLHAPRRGALPRPLAISVVYLALFGALACLWWLFGPQIGRELSELAERAPGTMAGLRDHARTLDFIPARYHLPPAAQAALDAAALRAYDGLLSAAASHARQWLQGLVYLPWLAALPILTFFLLRDGARFRRALLRAVPDRRVRWRSRVLFEDLNRTLAAYVRTQLVSCLLVGVICGLGLGLMRLPDAAALGAAAAVLEVLPLVGPVTFMALAVVVAVFARGAATPWEVLGFLLCLRLVQDYWLYPRIVKHGIHLHPLAVILAVFGGAEVDGVVGVFLAVPAVAVATILHRHWRRYRSGAAASDAADEPWAPQRPAIH